MHFVKIIHGFGGTHRNVPNVGEHEGTCPLVS